MANAESTETKTKGRQPDVNPNKVLTPKFTRAENGRDLILTVPYNDAQGVRQEGTVTLSVHELSGLQAKVQ